MTIADRAGDGRGQLALTGSIIPAEGRDGARQYLCVVRLRHPQTLTPVEPRRRD